MKLSKSVFAKVLAVSLSFGLLAGCSKKTEIKGKEFIPRDTLVQVILDLHLIDGITNGMSYYRAYNPGDSINMYSEIFNKYSIDTTIYNHTLREYSRHPELLNSVYDDVLMELNKKLDEVNESEEKETAKDKPITKDSPRLKPARID